MQLSVASFNQAECSITAKIPGHAGIVVYFEHPEDRQDAELRLRVLRFGQGKVPVKPAIWAGKLIEDSLCAGISLTRAY